MEAPSRSQAWTVEDVVAVLLGCADPEAAALVLLNIATWQRIGNGITEAELCRRALVNQAGLYRVLSDIGQQHDAAFPDRPDLLLTWTSGEERYWTMEPTTAQTALLALPRFQVIHGGGASFPPDLT